ncbi:MAG: rRNA maturation RNase YbeY [Candidatus Sungbacteria bacterium]|nr:rRNA maturation RNase YbeY [Candidatus Sungbacteria bacterium]
MPKFSVRVVDRTKKHPREARLARVFCEHILKTLVKTREFAALSSFYELAVGIILVSPAESRSLNRRFRKRRYTPDVLTFPVFDNWNAVKKVQSPSIDLGDIVICPRAVLQGAAKSEKSFYAQFFWTITHGILHGVGFDHERGAGERRRMERLEERILENLSILLPKQKAH